MQSLFFSKKFLNHICDPFENDCKIRSWKDLKAKLDLDDNRINRINYPQNL